MIQEITKSDHKLIKKIASLKEKKYRERFGEFLVEGALSLEWALSSGYKVCDIVFSSDFVMSEALSEKLKGRDLVKVPPHLFAKMADTKTPQGILCTCALPEQGKMPETGLFVYCDRVRDPGNLGTIIRTADAMGFDGVVLSPDCVDPFNPKLVRSTMGSLFHIALFDGVDYEMLTSWQSRGFRLVVSALSESAVTPEALTVSEKTVLVMGNEASGVSEAILQKADTVVKIPMAGSAESLNVAAAAAILMYNEATKTGRI